VNCSHSAPFLRSQGKLIIIVGLALIFQGRLGAEELDPRLCFDLSKVTQIAGQGFQKWRLKL